MNIVKPEDTDIMYKEFEKVLSELKNGKSEGIDNIFISFIRFQHNKLRK